MLLLIIIAATTTSTILPIAVILYLSSKPVTWLQEFGFEGEEILGSELQARTGRLVIRAR